MQYAFASLFYPVSQARKSSRTIVYIIRGCGDGVYRSLLDPGYAETPSVSRATCFTNRSRRFHAKMADPVQNKDTKRITKHNRVRSGCMTCRQRRKKCDETKPQCLRCEQMQITCEWPTGFTFRLSGPGIDKGPAKTSKERRPAGQDIPAANLATFSVNETMSPSLSVPGGTDTSLTNLGYSHDEHMEALSRTVSDPARGSAQQTASPVAVRDQVHTTTQHQTANLDDLTVLNNTAMEWPLSNNDDWTWSPLEPMMSQSPDAFTMYYPNAEYRKLHATLYHAMVDTAKAGTRQ